jgi:hypothetical protein
MASDQFQISCGTLYFQSSAVLDAGTVRSKEEESLPYNIHAVCVYAHKLSDTAAENQQTNT